MNKNYDTPPLDLDWESDRILGYLTIDTTFVGSQTRYSETAATKIREIEIPDRVLGEGGEFLGSPAVFSQVLNGIDYQLLLVRDEGTLDPALIAFYDSDYSGGTLRIAHSGSLVVRPSVGTPPKIGIWYIPET